MSLGNRHAALHDTVSVRKIGMDTSIYNSFAAGQRVMTVDQVAGQVTAVWDGPVPGYEEYEVRLDSGVGGGKYTASQLTAVGAPVTGADQHLASEDYPEMGNILFDRPPIEREAAADRSNEDEPQDSTSMADPFAWADDDPRLQSPDLSRQLPGDGRPGPANAVEMPPYVDPSWGHHTP
jgi:hypothetical protein